MPTVPPTTPPPGLPSVTGTPSAGATKNGPPKAGKRTRYIENNQIGSSADRLRQMLGRYWVAGNTPPPVSPGGVDPVKMPIIVKVGKTSAIDKTTECPFVKYKNSIRIEPNPVIFKPKGSTSALDSFHAFLYGTGTGGIPLLAFTPFWNLVPSSSPTAYAETSPEFDAFLEEYDIIRRTVGDFEFLFIPGILRGCSEFGGMTVRDPQDLGGLDPQDPDDEDVFVADEDPEDFDFDVPPLGDTGRGT